MCNLGNLEDFVYVLHVSCYRTCAVFIKCPKCSGYVKDTLTWQIHRKVHSMHSCNHYNNVLQVSYCRTCAVYIICPKYSGYVKGTSTPE